MRFSFALVGALALGVVASPSSSDCVEHSTAAHDAIELLQPLLTEAEAIDLLAGFRKLIRKRKPLGQRNTTQSTSSSVAGVVKLAVPASNPPPVSTSAVVAAPVSAPTSSPAAVVNTWSGKTKTVKKKATPKVKDANKNTVVAGTKNAVDGFAHSGYVPEAVAIKLQEALQAAIDAQLAAAKGSVKTKTVVNTVPAPTSTSEANSTSSNSTITAAAAVATPLYVTLTSVETQTIYTNDSLATTAALNIKKALESAFAAANMSQSGLDAATTASLEKCLETVLAAGGLPEGYSCITSSGSDSAGLTSTLNTILEQFVGILPNTILSSVFDAVTPILGNLLPTSENALVDQIKDSIQSVIASLSGNSVTALEQVQQCYTSAIQQKGNSSTLACITKPGGAMSTLQTSADSMLNQFIGVLPASLTTAVQNILTFNLKGNSTQPNEKLAAEVSAQISNAINSVASSLSGNTATLAITLQGCASQLIATGNATAAENCLKKSSAPVLSQTMFMSIAQQFAGYLPSSFFTDLVNFSSSHLANSTENPHKLTQAELNKELDTFFNNATSYGPAYVTCLAQVQACVTKAVEQTGSAAAVCPGPVKGCVSSEVSSSHTNSTDKVKVVEKKTVERRHIGGGVSSHERFSRWAKVKA